MGKFLIACAIVAATSAASASAVAQPRGHGGNGGGGHGSWGSSHGNWSGHGAWRGGRDFHGGGRWSGWHGGHGFRGYGSIYLGWPGYWWGPSYWPSYYYDYAPSYYYYDAPAYSYGYPGPDVYVERVAPAAQWYCPDAGYYPTVRTCPGGWQRVVPDGGPPR